MAKAKSKKKTAKKTSAKSGKVKKELKKKKPVKSTSKKIVKKVPVKKKTVKKAAPKKTKVVSKVKKTVKKAVKKTVTKKAVAPKVRKPIAVKKKEEDFITPEMVAARRAAALKKIKGYSKKDLDHFREVIFGKRDEILEQLQNLREQMLDPTTGEYINENSPYSLHMAEQGTDAMEREKTYLYAQRENKFLGYLEDALKRIDNGIYGICVDCIEEPQHLCPTCPLIPKERLEAVPHSQLCLPMKQKQEKR
jgi:DnaK suppressor protein